MDGVSGPDCVGVGRISVSMSGCSKNLTALGSELFFDQIDEVADRVHGLQFGRLEFDLQARFYGDDEVDVVERVPLGHAGGGEVGGQDERVVVEDVVEDAGELRVDFLLLHEGGCRLS